MPEAHYYMLCGRAKARFLRSPWFKNQHRNQGKKKNKKIALLTFFFFLLLNKQQECQKEKGKQISCPLVQHCTHHPMLSTPQKLSQSQRTQSTVVRQVSSEVGSSLNCSSKVTQQMVLPDSLHAFPLGYAWLLSWLLKCAEPGTYSSYNALFLQNTS